MRYGNPETDLTGERGKISGMLQYIRIVDVHFRYIGDCRIVFGVRSGTGLQTVFDRSEYE